ncbi:hypothetical protein V8B97DRAFT_2008889 [Scleroderma yunnanense]
MGPPHRVRSHSSVSASNHSRQPSNPDPTQQPHPSIGMSPASRYSANMKVVRRRDPSIVSIFDQFSHVCVYHHNGDKWEKHGFEGSMFLYERISNTLHSDSYPPYGFYIMNRVGMEDYNQRLYPEDGVGAHGNYLMLRHYPDFTARRIADARAILHPSLQDSPATKFAPEFAIADLEKLHDIDKGQSQTVSLWCLATDARESMTDVMLRLHSYIKQNLPYPDEHRYGPHRPPPPNFRSLSRGSEWTHTRSTSSASTSSSIHRIPESGEEDSRNVQSTITPASVRSVSELDKLFAKLGGVPSQSQSQRPAQAQASSTPDATVANLLSDMLGPSRTSVSPSLLTTAAPTRGLSLLDTIFASATPPSGRAPSQPYHSEFVQSTPSATYSNATDTHTPTAYSQDHHILSPKPTSSALPQVLNQEVISTLLGLPPSRASSVRYEGDNESSDDGASEPGSLTASIPQLAIPHDQVEGSSTHNSGRILGDVTPRASLRGFGSDIYQVSDLLTAAAHAGQQQERTPAPSSTHLQIPIAKQAVLPTSTNDVPFATNSTHAVNCNDTTNAKNTNNLPRIRPLVPFETDSDLWPYPRAPLVETDSDIVELDFADTSALSDPDAFEKRLKGKKQKKKKDKQKEREEIENSWDVPPPVRVASPAGVSQPVVNGSAKHHNYPRENQAKQQATSPPPATTTIATPSVTNSTNRVVDTNGVRTSLLSTIAAPQHTDRLKNLTKKDFVSEVLSLIYVRIFYDR